MDKNELWAKAREELLRDVADDDPKSVFLKMLKPLGIYNNMLLLLSTSEHVESWVRKNYMDDIRAAVRAVGDAPYSVDLGTADETPQAASFPPVPVATPAEAPVEQPPFVNEAAGGFPAAVQPIYQPAQQPDWMSAYTQPEQTAYQPETQPQQHAQPQPAQQGYYPEQPGPAAAPAKPQPERGCIKGGNEALFSKCTFDTFVVGKSNEFARGAALAVAEQPGIAYNPLFIYGGSGLGKTHLMVAIANYISINYPRMTICYASANEFLNDYVEATQRNQWSAFNGKYHQVDVLLVDDIQYLEGKEETINQLFRIFNEMTGSNKQIVLSADRSPKDIEMDVRMSSRFASGMTVDVKAPDYETRLAIIKNCYLRMQQTTSFFGVVPDEVLSYLAETANSNIREMEGAFTRLIGSMTFRHNPGTGITIEEAKEVLEDFFPDMADTQVTIAAIQSEVERFFKVSHEDLISSKRSKGITYPRHIAIYLSRYMTDESLESIGRKFGNRDHTTVMYSVKKIELDQQDNRTLFDQLEQLRTRIKERG